MRITVCYPRGETTVSIGCKVFGFGAAPQGIGQEWIPYAAFDLPDDGRIAPALIDALAMYEVEYGDGTFSSAVPESANVTAGLIGMVLARDDFSGIPYRSLTRQWNADVCTETVRRTVPASAITEP